MQKKHQYKDDGFDIFTPLSSNESGWAVRDFSETRDDGSFFWFGDSTNERMSAPIDARRLLIISLCCLFGLFVLGARSLYLQVVRYDHYSSLAEHNRTKTKVLYANRGLLFDRNGTPLVENIPQYSLWVIPSELPKKDEEKMKNIQDTILSVFSEEEKVSKEEFLQLFARASEPTAYTPVLVKNNIDYKDVVYIQARAADLPGIEINVRATRKYEDIPSIAHVIGYVGSVTDEDVKKGYDRYDIVGKNGVEASYEKDLKGKNGYIHSEVNSSGQVVKHIAREISVEGKSLVLTIDSDLQKYIAEVMTEYVRQYGARGGAGIVVNPWNGEILALVSVPYFDPNILTVEKEKDKIKKLIEDKDKQPFFNRAISAAYPLGSIFKLFVAAGALDMHTITKTWTVMSTGGIQVNNSFFKDWKAGGHGITNLTKAIAESINTYFYTIGGGFGDHEGIGHDAIVSYAKKFGFGELPKTDLPGAVAGNVPTNEWKQEKIGERWYLGDTYNLSIGQGYLTVSPLQVVAAISVIANKGMYYVPHLLARIKEGEKVVSEYDVHPTSIGIDSDTFIAIQEGMREAVRSGSAKQLSLLSISSAGKTATAQVGNKGKYNAWYAGFAPYENPEVAFVFMLEHVGGGGDRYAVPIAESFLQYYFNKEKE